MAEWSAEQYLLFADERTRAARDLLAQVPSGPRREVVDLGCGPGNSTELLVARFPQARVCGVDSSPDMLRQARQQLPALSFEEADLATYAPPTGTDLLFANAVFQWVPNHLDVMAGLLDALAPDGVLAVQMPDNLAEPSHRLMREIAATQPFAGKLAEAITLRDRLAEPAVFYDRLKPLCSRFDVWHTIYNFVLAGPDAVIEWVKGTGLRPFLAPLDAREREAYLVAYRAAIAAAYPLQTDGKLLLRFPRFFLVAVK
ncbi:trans-aconitate 2-methyltransferase [Chelatococcus reniformis]|uniref:Trans-aconitate 2-methyltransferase n=1 Tax=Chelatococcus reniformis TaxID=1494448 RepID=A0A916UBH5_9HYPH|nr:trans-aconitate 2-methyltransferase [Chelatococcus reniformis]GGC66941.1 trans-aconitate 2-methyltransferase [Chelatococcus reniformis]